MVEYEEVWDKPSLRKRKVGSIEIEKYYEDLSLLTIRHIIDIHEKVAQVGKTNKVGVRSEKYLKQIYEDFQENVQNKINIFYIVTKFMKSIVRFRPFNDANRRTLFETGQKMLRICKLEMYMSQEEAKGFKSSLRTMSFEMAYKIVQESARSIS